MLYIEKGRMRMLCEEIASAVSNLRDDRGMRHDGMLSYAQLENAIRGMLASLTGENILTDNMRDVRYDLSRQLADAEALASYPPKIGTDNLGGLRARVMPARLHESDIAGPKIDAKFPHLSDASVSNNPIYEGAASTGENPMAESDARRDSDRKLKDGID